MSSIKAVQSQSKQLNFNITHYISEETDQLSTQELSLLKYWEQYISPLVINKKFTSYKMYISTFKNLFQKKLLKEIVKNIVGFQRRRNINELEKFRPKRKKIIRVFDTFMEKKFKFLVSHEDLSNIRLQFTKRSKTSKTKTYTGNIGRIIRYSNDASRKDKISLYPTIIVSAKRNRIYNDVNKIKKEHYLYPIYEQKEIHNIMLVLDSSKSISWVIPNIEKLISIITFNVRISKDKLGLIGFHNDTARIYHYPTTNTKLIIGSINDLDIGGFTPLAEGLKKAINIFSHERYQIQGVKNIILLVSDCFPEPLQGGFKNLFDEPSYKNVLYVSEKIKESKIKLMIIYPREEKDDNELTWGIKLAKALSEKANGELIEIHPEMRGNFITGFKYDVNKNDLQSFISKYKQVVEY